MSTNKLPPLQTSGIQTSLSGKQNREHRLKVAIKLGSFYMKIIHHSSDGRLEEEAEPEPGPGSAASSEDAAVACVPRHHKELSESCSRSAAANEENKA